MLAIARASTSTVVAKPRPRADGSPASPQARWPSLGLEAHEYFHLFNVKRLRPIELGPFNFEKAPTTASLWIAEGVTSYYSGLLMTRSGLQTPDEYLASLSSLVRSVSSRTTSSPTLTRTNSASPTLTTSLRITSACPTFKGTCP